MLRRSTLTVLALLCLAISLASRALDGRQMDAHAAVLAATTAGQDPNAPGIKILMGFDTPMYCAQFCTLSRNALLLDTISIATLILGLAFALAALWKYVK